MTMRAIFISQPNTRFVEFQQMESSGHLPEPAPTVTKETGGLLYRQAFDRSRASNRICKGTSTFLIALATSFEGSIRRARSLLSWGADSAGRRVSLPTRA